MELGIFKRDFKKFVSKFPGNIQTILKTKTYLAGGAIRSRLLNQIPKDYDIFFLDRESRSKVMMHLEGMSNVLFTHNAYTVRGDEGSIPFQLIRKDLGSPTEVVSRFDFTCNMNFYMPANDWSDVAYIDHILERKLVFNPKACAPLSALIRLNRFLKEGWTIESTSLARIGTIISRMDPIRTAEQLQQLGLSEYSTPSVGSVNFEEVLASDLQVAQSLANARRSRNPFANAVVRNDRISDFDGPAQPTQNVDYAAIEERIVADPLQRVPNRRNACVAPAESFSGALTRETINRAVEQMTHSMERNLIHDDTVPVHPSMVADVQQVENL